MLNEASLAPEITSQLPDIIDYQNRDEYIAAYCIVEEYLDKQVIEFVSDRAVLEAYIKGGCVNESAGTTLDLTLLELGSLSDQELIKIAKHFWFFNKFKLALNKIDRNTEEELRKKGIKLDLKFSEHRKTLCDAAYAPTLKFIEENPALVRQFLADDNPYVATRLMDKLQSAVYYSILRLRQKADDKESAKLLKLSLDLLSGYSLEISKVTMLKKSYFNLPGFCAQNIHLFWLVFIAHHYYALATGYFHYYKLPNAEIALGQSKDKILWNVKTILGMSAFSIKAMREKLAEPDNETYRLTQGKGNIYYTYRYMYDRDSNEKQVVAHPEVLKVMREQCLTLAYNMEFPETDEDSSAEYAGLYKGIQLFLNP